MKNTFYIKEVTTDSQKELSKIGFDNNYIEIAKNKYKNITFKIFNLTSIQANLMKQTCLSLGFDCAINKNCLTNKIEYSDVLINANISQMMHLTQKLMHQQFSLPLLSKKIEEFLNQKLVPIKIKNKNFNWKKPYLMGVLNLTPDSFSDGGDNLNPETAFENFQKLIAEGADIIDIGAESTRPNSTQIDEKTEIKRLLPFLKKIKTTKIPLSLDTYHAKTAEIGIQYGIDIINDISFLRDKKMIEILLKYKPFYILTHNSIQNKKTIDEIFLELKKKIDFLLSNGVEKKKLIIDIGLGFKQNKKENIEILKHIKEFKSLGLPLLVGASRKSFLECQNNEDGDFKTAIISSYLAKSKVNIIRVHNLKMNKKSVEIADLF